MTKAYASSPYAAHLYGQKVLDQPIRVEVQGEIPGACSAAIEQAIDLLKAALQGSFNTVCSGVTVRIGNGLVDGGGEASAEENLILLDREKMGMSLQDAENLLVRMGMFNPGERVKTLPESKDKPFSCLVYELVHEMGHIADGKLPGPKYKRANAELSPTKYGKQNKWEAFAEIFTYWVTGCPQANAAEKLIKTTLGI